jgi:AraC-like DNA-binding protein
MVPRVARLFRLTVQTLKAWREDGWVKLFGHAPRPSDPVWPRVRSEVATAKRPARPRGSFYHPASARLLREDLKAVGVPDTFKGEHPIDAHALRRTFATPLSDAKVPDAAIAALMGHAKQGVTDANYISRNLGSFVPHVLKLDLGLYTNPAGGREGSEGGKEKTEIYLDSERLDVSGGVAEWSKAAVLKTADGASCPGVRIPSPPLFHKNLCLVRCGGFGRSGHDGSFLRRGDRVTTGTPVTARHHAHRVNADDVRASLGRRSSGERPAVDEVARSLGLSSRTLQRRLGEQGTTYQALLDDLRHRSARRLLASTDLDAGEVAFLLGFEEAQLVHTRFPRLGRIDADAVARDGAPTTE